MELYLIGIAHLLARVRVAASSRGPVAAAHAAHAMLQLALLASSAEGEGRTGEAA